MAEHCLAGRVIDTSSSEKLAARCTEPRLPNRTFCEKHLEEARRRVPALANPSELSPPVRRLGSARA